MRVVFHLFDLFELFIFSNLFRNSPFIILLGVWYFCYLTCLSKYCTFTNKTNIQTSSNDIKLGNSFEFKPNCKTVNTTCVMSAYKHWRSYKNVGLFYFKRSGNYESTCFPFFFSLIWSLLIKTMFKCWKALSLTLFFWFSDCWNLLKYTKAES